MLPVSDSEILLLQERGNTLADPVIGHRKMVSACNTESDRTVNMIKKADKVSERVKRVMYV